MTEHPAGSSRQPRFGKTRAAAVGFGLGATLALSPLVWAQNTPANTPAPNAAAAAVARSAGAAAAEFRAAGQAGAAGRRQHLGHRTVGAGDDGLRRAGSRHRRFRGMPEQFRGSPFEDFMRRFFDNNNDDRDDDSATPGPFSEGPGDGAASGSRSAPASSSIRPGSS